MKDCRTHIRDVKPYRTGMAGLTADDLLALLDAAETNDPRDAAEARAFFEEHCRPFFVRRSDGGSGFVTAFFEPEIEVSAIPDETYRYPFYRRPDDLIDLDDGNRPATLDASYMFGRLRDGAISAYPIAARSIGATLKARVWKSPGRNPGSTPSSCMCRARRVCAIRMDVLAASLMPPRPGTLSLPSDAC